MIALDGIYKLPTIILRQRCQLGPQVSAKNRCTNFIQVSTVWTTIRGNVEISIGLDEDTSVAIDDGSDLLPVILIDRDATQIVVESGLQGHFHYKHSSNPLLSQG